VVLLIDSLETIAGTRHDFASRSSDFSGLSLASYGQHGTTCHDSPHYRTSKKKPSKTTRHCGTPKLSSRMRIIIVVVVVVVVAAAVLCRIQLLRDAIVYGMSGSGVKTVGFVGEGTCCD
jgi:hypothetical protein